MAAKLNDSELARRTRESSQKRSSRYRERLAQSGKMQTVVWLPEPIRRELDVRVEARNQSLSVVTAELLADALHIPMN